MRGIDITKPFVEAANKLTQLLGLEDRVTIEHGNGHYLPYADETFDGAYTQHVTMNVADRAQFFAEAYRVSPAETRALLAAAGFVDIVVEDTGAKYLAAYTQDMDMVAQGPLPPLGTHILTGVTGPQKIQNAARNIEEGRTHPVQVVCRKPV